MLVAALSTARAGPGGSIDITSDYVLRGVSQSNGNPAWQADARWDFVTGFSAGLWASQVELLPERDSWELDSYLQWHGPLSADWDLGVSATYYSYPNDPRQVDYDYTELRAALTWRDQFRLAASWTPEVALYSFSDGLAEHRQAWAVEGSWHRDLPARLDLVIGLGYYYPPGLDDASYAYGDATLGWEYGHWRVNLAWIWAQNAAHRQYTLGPDGGPLVGTLTWVF